MEAINKGASAGVDRVTTEEYAKDLGKHIVEVVDSLKGKRYRAKLVRRVNIPKGDGKTRPLGIPAVSDKLVQMAVAWILMAITSRTSWDAATGTGRELGRRMRYRI